LRVASPNLQSQKGKMTNLEHYRQCIQTILTKHGGFKPKQGDVETELIFDATNDHY
jgi:XisI protein